jgi:hypothetical protein
MDTSNVKESIDERILRLLGLEDVFDLDYDTYLTLLKEAMVKGRMPKTTIPTEEIEALTDEYKRVKGKKNKGRFEVKKGKKINSTSFNLGKTKGLIAGSKSIKALPAAIGTSPVSKSLDDNISAITAAVVSIHETIKQQQNLLSGSLETDRRRREKEKGDAAENKLEKRFEGLKKIAEKVISPVKSILDKIINFLVNVLLGRVVIKLIDWLADPKNASKVKSVIRFIGDWWPALLGAYVLFGTTFGKFVRGTVGMLGRFIFQIGKVAIPGLLKFIARNPLGTAAAALFLTGAGAELVPGLTGKKEEETKKAPGSTKDKIQQLQTQKANLNVFEKLQGKGSEIDEQISLLQTGKTKGYGFNGGGFNEFNGFVSGEKGVDKIHTMLSDGEFVMSRGAVALHGVDTLERMNAAGGGTNRPKIISGVPHADGGGLIGSVYEAVKSRNLKPVVDEIIRGLAPRYKWAKDLATKTGVVISNSAGNLLEGGQRVAGEGVKMINPTIQRAQRVAGEVAKRGQRVAGEGAKMINPTIQRAQRVVGEVKKKVDPVIKGIPGFVGSTMGGLKQGLSAAAGASEEAIPAVMNSIRGLSVTDTNISEDMQRQILQAKQTARKRGSNNIAYEDYAGGGRFSAGGLTMGRIGNNEFKRDDKGRIIGLRQVYDTDTTYKKAMGAFNDNMKQFGSSIMKGKPDMKALMGGYKLMEAALAGSQDRGKTMHDVNFSEKVLGFKPGKEVLNDTQRGMIAAQKNREALQAKRPWWDQAGKFGGASRDIQEQAKIAKSKPVAKPVKPPSTPRTRFVNPNQGGAKTKSQLVGRSANSKVPNFTAGAPGMGSKTRTLGLRG